MKGITIKIQALLLCGVLITGLFSSCASDDNIETGTKVNPGDKVLTLTLNTPKATTTRATNITGNSDEDKINLLTIGIFDNLGTTVRTIQELAPGTGFTTPTGTPATTTATLVTNSLASGDQVLVAVNAPSGTFNGCANVSQFNGKAITADVALATPFGSSTVGTSEVLNNIPMYGDASTSGTGGGVIVAPTGTSTTYTAKVSVQHQLAKITLQKLAVAFDPTGPYAKATFIPTSFFLINVPDNLNFNAASWSSSAKWQGYDNSAAGTSTYKEYLGTGNITTYSASPMKVGGTSFITPGNIFYTMPSSDVNNNIKLVIGGTFDSDGDGVPDTDPVYYPVNINWVYDKAHNTSSAATNGGPIAKSVYPNKNYVCTVNIMTKGAKLPTDKIDPEAVSVDVTVLPFDPATQTTDFE